MIEFKVYVRLFSTFSKKKTSTAKILKHNELVVIVDICFQHFFSVPKKSFVGCILNKLPTNHSAVTKKMTPNLHYSSVLEKPEGFGRKT